MPASLAAVAIAGPMDWSGTVIAMPLAPFEIASLTRMTPSWASSFASNFAALAAELLDRVDEGGLQVDEVLLVGGLVDRHEQRLVARCAGRGVGRRCFGGHGRGRRRGARATGANDDGHSCRQDGCSVQSHERSPPVSGQVRDARLPERCRLMRGRGADKYRLQTPRPHRSATTMQTNRAKVNTNRAICGTGHMTLDSLPGKR